MPDGFRVDVAGVRAAGGSACDLAEQLRAARSTWDGATRDGGAACGIDVAGTAYTAMQDAWFAEIGVHITVLEQACQALRDNAKGYGNAERLHSEGFHG